MLLRFHDDRFDPSRLNISTLIILNPHILTNSNSIDPQLNTTPWE
jgi:hypothetical protein